MTDTVFSIIENIGLGLTKVDLRIQIAHLAACHLNTRL